MSVIAEVEKLAFSLPDNERAKLADRLLASLPGDFIEEDEIAEAVRRSRELEEHPEIAISLEELDRRMQDRLK